MNTAINTSFQRIFGSAQAMRYVCAMVVMLLSLGVGSAWASHSTHYNRANVALATGSTGSGTVYLIENNTHKTQSNQWDCGGSSSGTHSKNFECHCEGWSDGYYFAGWNSSPTASGSYSNTNATATLSFGDQSSTSSPGDKFYYAWILSVKPTAASGDMSFNVNNLSNTFTKTVSFAQTGGDAQADFNNATIVSKSGGGTWTHVSTTYNSSTTKVDVVYAYTSNRSTWTNVAGTRTDEATLTLSSKGNEQYSVEVSANLPNASISAGTGSSVSMDNATETQSGTVTFPVTYVDNKGDLNTPTIAKTSGEGTWAITGYSYSAGVVTVNYSHTGSGTYGTRASAATITLSAKIGGSSNTCNVTASYPAVTIGGGEDSGAYPLATEDASGTATFFVNHADGIEDFIIPESVENSTGGTWNVDAGSAIYTQSAIDPSAGTVTVDYTYNAGEIIGSNTAEITLEATNGATYLLSLTGMREAAAVQDVSVTTAGGVETKYDTWAEGLAAANAADGCTLKLLRDVEGISTSQVVTKTMTLDLNHFVLSGTLSAAGGLLKLNTAGKVLTITDRKSDGAIRVSGNIDGRVSAVEILKGALVLGKGDLSATNANTGETLANKYVATVYLAAGTTMSMTNGNITANRTGASGKYCFGIYCEGTGASASSISLTGGTITASFANGGYAEGVFAAGSSLIQNMNVTATSKSMSYSLRVEDGQLVVNGGTYTSGTTENGARGIYTKTAPNAKNAVVVSNATFNVTAGTTDAKGFYCASTTSTMSGDPTDANVALSNVIVTATTTGTATSTNAYAIHTDAGVCLAVSGGTYTANANKAGAYALNTNGYTAVVSGTFSATASTTDAYAINVAAGITAVKSGAYSANAVTDKAYSANIVSEAKLLVYGGSFTGHLSKVGDQKYAVGAYVNAGGALEAQGGTFLGTAANTTLGAAQKAYACGVYAQDGASTINMTNATMRGELQSTYLTNGGNSTWSGGAYGIYARSTNPLGLTNCTISANNVYQGGFGLRFANTPAEVRNCTVNVTTTKAYNYGLFIGGTACNVKLYDCDFTCTSGTTYAYGIYAYSGKISAENCNISATCQRTGASSADNAYLYGININTGRTATLTGCTITATGSGAYSNNGYGVYVDGTADIEDCAVTVSGINSGAYAIYNTANTTRIGVASGKFKATATTTGVGTNSAAAAEKEQLYGGYFTTKSNLEKYLPAGYGIETLPTTAAEYAEGYRYAIRPSANVDPVCKIGSTPYYTLEEALEYAGKNASSSNKLTILMVANYTLPAGNYTLPQYTTLLVPMKDQTSLKDHPDRVYNTYSYPTCYKKLTFAEGVHMDVYGTIQTGGKQSAIGQISQQANTANNGTPTESYGWIYLSAGSTITLENGSQLYSWGYVTGALDADGKYLCEIDAKRGSTVHESFMVKDWRGGSATAYNFAGSTNKNTYKVFPLNQYYIQNIEVPIKFRPGSAEYCDGTVSASSASRPFNDVKLIGVTNTGSFFEMANDDMSEDTWVRKWYDVANDKQVYEINSSASLNNITLSLYGTSFSSSSFVLPITNNMKIHLLTGSMNITQNTELLPGSEIEIDKEATAYIASGKSLYVFDIDEWNAFYTNEHTFPLPYSPSWAGSGKTCPRSRKVTEDAKVNVHGKFVVNGKFYTTAGGANIYSSDEDAGTITFGVAAPTEQASVYVNNGTSSSNGQGYTERKSNSAYLKNGDGTYEHTAGTVKNKSWVYYDGKWNCWEEHDCFGYDSEDHPYAKPRAYVQLTSNVADANHLYHDAETGERAFIVEDGCTWWEVEPVPYDGNKYKCVDSDYDDRYKYYEYVSNKWQEAVVSITWKNGASTLATYNKALYGVRPTYLDATPSKSPTSTEYYTWIGWTKDDEDEGEFFAKEDELPYATGNTTYYAKFESHKYQYAVTFKNYDGSVLQATPWEAGQVPYYLADTDPVKPATDALVYSFTGWSPAFTAVTGPTTYTAQYDAGTPRTYTVQWVNYDGTVLKDEQVAYGTTPSEPVMPTRPNDAFYTYTFNCWTPVVSSVTGNQTYTATYDYSQKVTKYTITFKNGSTTLYSQSLPNGETPVYGGSTPTRDDEQYTYTFDGWATTDGGAKLPSLPAVSGAAQTYYAVYTTELKSYTIRWKSIDDKQTYETDDAVLYGTTPSYDGATPTKARLGATVFTFDGWSATKGGDKIALPNVTGNATYYAHFTDDPVYTVTFDMQSHGAAIAEQEVVKGYQVTEPADPAVAEWIFGGWYKESACTNAWNFSSDVVTANTTLYAKWTLAAATVTNNSGTTNHATIAAAFTAANGAASASTIKLLQNAAVANGGVTYNGSQNCTLDLNGHTLSYSGEGKRLLIIDNASTTFTINDLTEDKLGTLSLNTSNPTSTAAFCVYVTKGTLRLEAGKVYLYSTSTTANAVSVRIDNSNFIMNGGTAQIEVTQSGRNAYAMQSIGTATATVNDGNSIAKAVKGNAYGMYVTGTMTINGGKFHITGQTASVAHPSASDPSKVLIKGGYYNTNTGLAGIVAPGKSAWKYYAFATTDAEKAEVGSDYNFMVAEAYTLEWTTDGNALTGDYTYGLTKTGATLVAPDTPTKTGYTFDSWSPAFTGTMPAANTEYTATWTPNTDTKYTVKHWLQNIEDDDYTEVTDDRETKEGTTATTTAATANTYTGFTAQPISQGTIAADGSAVVNVYYNRNKYTVTWLDGDGTTIKTDANVKYGATPSYEGSTPTKSDDEDCTYSFIGMWTPAFETVTGDQSYTALFNAVLKGEGFGTYLDIVDWTESTLTINANGWVGSGWPYTINGVAYLKSDRADDRTLTIPYSGSADDELCIIVRKTGGVNYSGHYYTIPHIYNSSATLSGTTASSVVFVRGGSLTVAADATLGAVYVAPEAELIVNEDVTLTVDSLMLRTTAWKAASLEKKGTIAATKAYYTRIATGDNGYFQFALPLATSIKRMHLSDYSKCTYGTSWLLKCYSEESRAENGTGSSNWVMLDKPVGDADVAIAACTGYELCSNSMYYREYYFPVTLPAEQNTTLPVSHTEGGAAGSAHAGWNALCSPLLGKYKQHFADPSEGIKVSLLMEDGHYMQTVPQTINPVVPFYYQAPVGATSLDFSGAEMTIGYNAPGREWNRSVQTQWLQVSVNDVNGKILDQTGIYCHPEKFSVAYETGYDVAKQSTDCGRAAIYTELACGKLAFAAIPDSLAATYVPLTVYAGADCAYVFTLEDNGYTGRLQYVLLHDTETGAITDLMSGSYTAELAQGTNAGRFYIECVFHEDAPAIVTGTENTNVMKQEVGQKIIYNEKIFILYRGRIYDMTGRLCELH